MLSESLQELLSAYVDGELSPAEYDRVLSALRESELARDYVNSLRALHDQFKAVPKLTCPPNLTTNLLKQQKAKQLKARSSRLSWGVGLAASMLIGLGIWWIISTQNQGNAVIVQPDNLAKVVPTRVDGQTPLPSAPVQPSLQLAEWQPLLASVNQAARSLTDGLQTRFSDSLTWLAEADTLREGRFLESQPTLLTSPVKSSGTLFKTVETTLPLQINPTELDLLELQTRLTQRGPFVLDISARSPSKALERLVTTAGFPIAIDDELKQKLNSSAVPTTMLYVDAISKEQLIAWLEKLKLADYWTVQEYRTDGACRSLLLYPLEASGQEQVLRSFGLSKWSAQKSDKDTKPGLALTYQPNRKTTTLSKEMFKQISYLHGPSKEKVSLVIMVRSER